METITKVGTEFHYYGRNFPIHILMYANRRVICILSLEERTFWERRETPPIFPKNWSPLAYQGHQSGSSSGRTEHYRFQKRWHQKRRVSSRWWPGLNTKLQQLGSPRPSSPGIVLNTWMKVKKALISGAKHETPGWWRQTSTHQPAQDQCWSVMLHGRDQMYC